MMVNFWQIIGLVALGYLLTVMGAIWYSELGVEEKIKSTLIKILDDLEKSKQQQSAPEQETENND